MLDLERFAPFGSEEKGKELGLVICLFLGRDGTCDKHRGRFVMVVRSIEYSARSEAFF